MIFPAQVETGRQRLEDFLNEQISLTERYRRKIVNSYYRDILAGELVFPIEEISRDAIERELKNDRRLMCVPKNAPEIIGRGEHQITINVGDGLVAKLVYKKFLSSRERTVSVGERHFAYMKNTRMELLHEDIDVPPLHFLAIDWEEDRIVVTTENIAHSNFHWIINARRKKRRRSFPKNKCASNGYLTTDLREHGRYCVVDYSPSVARRLVNATSIIEEYEQKKARLLSLYRSFQENPHKKGIIFDPHYYDIENDLKSHPSHAIQRMFFLQVPVDPTEEGKLVVGDIDHVYVFR